MTLVCFIRHISNYCPCDWFSLLLQAPPDVLCDIQVVKWVPHNNHFSINFYMLNWLYSPWSRLWSNFLHWRSNQFLLFHKLPQKIIASRCSHSYPQGWRTVTGFHIRYIRLRSKSSNTEYVQTQYISDILFRKEDPDPPSINMVDIICSTTLSGRGTLTGSSLQNLSSSCD